MGVIVTGMEMPESCSDCPICHCKGKDDPWNYYCSATMNDIDIQEWDLTRYNNCPLKSVEEMIEKIEQQQKVISLFKGLSGADELKGMNDCIRIIKEYCGMDESNGES